MKAPLPLVLAVVMAVFSHHTSAADTATDSRQHSAAEIFINSHRYGDETGCISGLKLKGHLTCGHPKHVSEVKWKYLRTTAKGDTYQITRKYPSDTEQTTTDTKEVIYSGTELTVWKDDYQKIILRPQQ